jgi:regulator of protease activity HflC (stomatin/prohibitin superfamily)
MFGVYVIKQYERAVVFDLGKVKGDAREPGLMFCVPLVNRIHRVSLRIITRQSSPRTMSASTCPRWRITG